MYSRTKDINYFTGNAIQTAYNDRNPLIVPNSVNKNSEWRKRYLCKKIQLTPITSSNIYKYWGDGGSDMGSCFLVDKSYVKLRSVVLGWDLPKDGWQNSFPGSKSVCIWQ